MIFFSGYIPRNGIAGSYGNSIFSFKRNRHTVLHNGYTSFHSHQRYRRVPFLHTLTAFIVFRFSDGHSDWYEVVPHCGFDLLFSNSDFMHLFMCLLSICVSSLEKYLFRSTRLLIGLFYFFSI